MTDGIKVQGCASSATYEVMRTKGSVSGGVGGKTAEGVKSCSGLDRVMTVKERISSGDYEVDTHRLACLIVDKGLFHVTSD